MTEAAATSPLQALFDSCSNTRRWGENDARGTLNYVDADVVLRAVASITQGEVVALGTLPPVAAFEDEAEAVRLHVYENDTGTSTLDTLAISPHGYEITHLDAVGHSFFEGTAYNGRRAEDIVRARGLSFGGVEAMAGGIVTRGVLLDVARSRGVEHLEPWAGIEAGDLDAAESLGGTEVLAGDAVFVRAGIGIAPPGPDGRRTGLLESAVVWLHERRVSLYSGDCIERLPPDDSRLPMVLHQVGHVAMGLAILDNPDVERLRAACDRHGRCCFMLLVAPLGVPGATGCAVNPITIF